MRLIFLIIPLLLALTNPAHAGKVDIKCYPKADDRDNDGYAKEGSTATELEVSESSRYSCPSGFVPAADDCDDTRSSVHPYREEVAFNERDDNCSDETDENEFIYFENGFNNSDTSFKMRVKINCEEVIDRYHSGQPIYAKIIYRKINESSDETTDYIRIGLFEYSHPYIDNYKATNLTLTGLSSANIYRARVKFFYSPSETSTVPPIEIGKYGENIYYTTTTNTSNSVSQARTRILLRGFQEYSYQRVGLVGKNGSRWINGTRYEAGTHTPWCSEFYSWLIKDDLKNRPVSDGNLQVDALKEYFGNYYHRVHDLADLDETRRGDWLDIDLDNNINTGHTGMFLGIAHDGKVVTLEGNIGNRINIFQRDINLIYGYGSIRTSMLKN